MMLLHIGTLFLAIAVTPWLVSRIILPRQSLIVTLAGWGVAMTAMNVGVPIILHLLTIAITADSLAWSHMLLAGIVGVGFAVGKRCGLVGVLHGSSDRLLLVSAILFAVFVIPFSHIAGVDTYKWQDLAGNVAVEQRISWFIHPLSLFGYTPRSYSSAQPLILATIQMLGHTGVDWGFYILSVACGMAGLSGAWVLGRHLFKSDTAATWFGILYVFSPVFMRYNYWATGRGLMLALLPVYLLILLKLGEFFAHNWRAALCRVLLLLGHDKAWPSSGLQQVDLDRHRWVSFLLLLPAWLTLSLLLAMAHKAGLVGVILIPVLFIVSPILVLLRGRWGLIAATLLALSAGLLLVEGNLLTLTYRLLTRFGWLLPLFILALISVPERFAVKSFRAMLAAGLAALVLSCTPEMYGAMLALPFMAFVAAIGLEKLSVRPYGRLVLILIPALAIVINQTRDSPGESLYRAACFIEKKNPRGPFRIEAPGAARRQIQAYVSGCPRFTVQADPKPTIELNRPPLWTGSPIHDAQAWTHYFRLLFKLSGASTDWYGTGNKVYYVTVDREGSVPPQAKRLFQDRNVEVFESP
jgi:hypothetical protein